MWKSLIVFLVLNFAALAIGGLATTDGVISDWYQNLNKAPWTPPGWVFGAAWTFIMLTFSAYMSYLYIAVVDKKLLIILFAVQFVLNIAWNPIFFVWKNTSFGLVVISALTALMFYFLIKYNKYIGTKSYLVLPYCIWLVIATSLNLYIVLKN